MKRRDLIKFAALATGAATVQTSGMRALAPELQVPDPSTVKSVLVVFKCHLDVGFTSTQEKVLRKYFDVYYPQAMARAATMRAEGSDRYTWTTGSYLLYEYLEQATTDQRYAMERAIAAGDITWHALPFSWQTEMLDPTMIEGALSLSATLDKRFGHKTIGAKMSDVPGHSRGLISPLAAGGVRLLDIGVNSASTPPETPAIFLWRDQSGASIVMIYHHHAYGGVVPIPGTTTVFAMEMANDNAGPHSKEEINATYARLRSQFPNATIKASSLSEVAQATEPIRERLPVMTQEIGDTWIYGIPSDPLKVAQYRELARLRRQWLVEKKFAVGDVTDRQFLSKLLLAVEHTWGTDTKSYLDHDHYTPSDLKAALSDSVTYPGYKTMTVSWEEKRDDVTKAIESLPLKLNQQAVAKLKLLDVNRFDSARLKPLTGAITAESRHYRLTIDEKSGAIVGLTNKKTGTDWATVDHPLALFTYQTISAEEYAQFLETYVKSKEDWAPQDFGKPNIAGFGALSREWHPTLIKGWQEREGPASSIKLELKIDDAEAASMGHVAWPESVNVEILLPEEEPVIRIRVVSEGKPENRMPEAMWLTFDPIPARSSADAWQLEKVGQRVRISDVVRGGNRNMHAISERIWYNRAGEVFELATMDAPVIALGKRSPLSFSLDAPDMQGGIHVNLFNNAWGTNYPQWCGGTWSYRFTLKV